MWFTGSANEALWHAEKQLVYALPARACSHMPASPVASARVGRGLSVMVSSTRVTSTGLPTRLQAEMSDFCTSVTCGLQKKDSYDYYCYDYYCC